MGQTSITVPIGDVNVNADVNYQKVKEGSLFPKQRIVHRTPAGKRCVQVNSTVLEGSGKRILFHSTEKVYIDEDGQMIPSADVVDWLIEDDGTESQVNKFEQNMKKGAGVGVDTRVPRDMLRGFVIGDIYEIITEDEQQKWNLWQLAKDLWDNNEIGIIKEVVLSTGYTVRAGLLVPFVNEEEGYFYLELQLTTKKREPNGMTIPTSKPGPGPAPTKDDKKREHVGDILANPIGDNPSTHFTIEEAEPWVDGTYVPPGEYPIIDTTEGTVVIRADTYDDREGNLLHARNQQVTIVTRPELYTDEYEGIPYGEPEFGDHHYWKNNPTDLNELSRDDFIKELIDMELPYGDVQGLVMSYVITNNLGSNEEDEILKHYHTKSQEHLTKQSTLFNPTGVPNIIYRQLGGGRFVAMTGAKDFIADENTLIFKLRRGSAKNGINIVRITLNSMDLYDVKFQKYNYKTYDITDIKEYNNIYADQLKEIFEETTGLYTSLRNNPSDMDDIDDYVEDISTRYHAGRYADVLKLWREFSKDHTPQETIQLYSMLKRKGVTLSIGDLKRKMDRKSNPKRPPSEFWDEIYPDILKDYKKKFPTEKAKEIARKVVGDIWYNKMDSSSRKKYLRKEAKPNPKADLYEQEFKCPECGERVWYKAWMVPATYDEPGFIDEEWIERECKPECEMEDWELEDVGRDMDSGGYIEG